MKNRYGKNVKRKSNRFLVNIVFIFILLCIYGIGTNFDFGKKAPITNEIIVSQNDTIWNIANDICKEHKDLNIQNIIIEIKELNNLKSSDIYLGQVLNIPVY